MTLTNAVNATILDNTAVLTIINDDSDEAASPAIYLPIILKNN